ncbi:preprotein translocase subunit SecE [Oceanisphaera pacifica]|uniref:Protein translocase subunit SecE n=1 Tax=Oceanisphaera pacifica TaxID=2818389 RepID=A0ABS3NF81_9GAMM|nr:preprotein translocase subunit SecE [Oceanisphaera pacifica]MBO1519233.1 preprotein translocase subunit SecE [Oceanisphaera pacifica]
MSANIENQGGAKDTLLWGVVFIILIASIVANSFYSELPVAIRAAAVVVAVGIAALLAYQTTKGKNALAFAKESRLEMRKVVWPNRQEAIQTTLIVLAVTAVVGLFLFLLDGLLVWLVNLVTGV